MHKILTASKVKIQKSPSLLSDVLLFYAQWLLEDEFCRQLLAPADLLLVHQLTHHPTEVELGFLLGGAIVGLD